MKKFSDFKKINEDDQFSAKSLLPENTEKEVVEVENNEKEVVEIENGNASKEVTKFDPSKFFSKLFESREMAHIYHLQTKGDGSFAAHKALNDYYDGILELIDSIIEIYQGQYEIINGYDVIDTQSTQSKERIEYFTEFTQFIKDTRYMALSKEDTHLQNIVDEVVALAYRTLYKLKNLK